MSAYASSSLVRKTIERALKEAWCFTLTGLPLFRFMAVARGKTVGPPIVYAHGYGQTCRGFWALARALASSGRGPMFAYEYSSFDDIGHSADGLGRFIEAVRYATGSSTVDLIAHSMGGLVAVEHLRRAGPVHSVRRCITLASPHGGIRWPGPVPGRAAAQLRRGSAYLHELGASRLPIPLLSVSSETDDVVYPAAPLSAQGGRDVRLSGVGHVALLFSQEMFQMAAAFLDEAELRSLPSAPPNLAYRRVAELGPRPELPSSVSAAA